MASWAKATAVLLAALLTVALAQPREPVPEVDLSRHSVPLSQIYFDTFRRTDRALPLDRADADTIARLRDAIPPIHDPRYQAAGRARWLRDDDMVLGYASGGEAWAYPLRILNYHEIVNDELAGEPVLISYCPLCFSGVVYSRRLGERTLLFGNTSALYESDMVMLDYQTGSYWWQVAGRAIVGELTGAELTPLPSSTMAWRAWRELHPQTLVLSRDTGYDRPYDRDPFLGFEAMLDSGRFAFPVSDASRDDRLLPGTRVLFVRLGGEVRAYPLTPEAPAVINDVVGGQPLVVFVDGESQSGTVFSARNDGRRLSFVLRDGVVVDNETGSVWDAAGRGIDGPLRDGTLSPVASKTSFWYAAVAAEPEITLFVPGR